MLEAHRKDRWIDVHKLRAWRSGTRVHIDFHLILPRDLPLAEGHSEVKELEKLFAAHFGGLADVLIHLDPCDDPECPVCAHQSCEIRQETHVDLRIWNLEHLTCDLGRVPT
ncbi:MAG: cation transporter dimerization domain-containing protein [Desulfomonile sp.]